MTSAIYEGGDSEFVHFVEITTHSRRKTRVWQVLSRQYGLLIGSVSFSPGWRRYVFSPGAGTMFDAQCLHDIAAHCEMATAGWRGEIKSPA